MSWKRKSPGARRRRRLRRERFHWSYAFWLQVEKRVWSDMGLRGQQLQRAARLSARYVVGGGSPSQVVEMAAAHAEAIAQRWRIVPEEQNPTRSERVREAPWSARVTFN